MNLPPHRIEDPPPSRKKPNHLVPRTNPNRRLSRRPPSSRRLSSHLLRALLKTLLLINTIRSLPDHQARPWDTFLSLMHLTAVEKLCKKPPLRPHRNHTTCREVPFRSISSSVSRPNGTSTHHQISFRKVSEEAYSKPPVRGQLGTW